MMKSCKLKIGALALITTMAAAGVISSSLAWFHDYATMPEGRIDGSIRGAYFAYGDGSADEPYGIAIPRHLYNLAWLQDTGYFNRDLDGDGVLDTFYFEIDPSLLRSNGGTGVLDMEDYYIPPIGTTTYPFLGQFNGNGVVISDLNVTNSYADFGTNHPTAVNSSSYAANKSQVVGLFGVVGSIPNQDPNQEISYDSSTNIIKNVGLKGVTVKSDSENTLVGIAAGYVNGTLEKVAVDDGKIDVVANAGALNSLGATKISHYSLIGYGEEDALAKSSFRKDTASLPSAVNPNTISGGTEWGGSIAMYELYSQLADIRDSSDLFYKNTIRYYVDGVYDEEMSEASNEVARFGVTGDISPDYRTNIYARYEGQVLTEDDLDYASFTFTRRSPNTNFTSYGDDESQGTSASYYYYACLDGVRTESYTASKRTLTTLTSASAGSTTVIIGDGKGNFLRRTSNSAVGNTTDVSQATVWTWNNNRYLVNDTRRLVNNNGSLSLSTTGTTTWNVSAATGLITTGSTNYLTYNGTNWVTTTIDTTPFLYFYDDAGHYLSRSGNDATVTTRSSATKWYDQGGYFYADKNTSYRLMYYFSSSWLWGDTEYFVYIGSSGARSYYRYDSTNNVLKTTYNNNTYYLKYSGGSWGYTTSLSSATKITMESVTLQPSDYALSLFSSASSSTESRTVSSNPTYFPLLMDPEDNYKPKNGWKENPEDEKERPTFNTGYLVSGNNIRNTNAETFQKYFGDIRVAGFPYRKGSGSSSSDSLTQFTSDGLVHTRAIKLDSEGNPTDSQWETINTKSYTPQNKAFSPSDVHGLKKFKKSFDSLYSTLTESASKQHVYGLHFMDCEISMDHLVTIGKATVLDKPAAEGEEDAASIYENYQVPQDCIDFNLKNNGYVNFFAGSYFTNNNSFFSLHQIFRNEYVEPNPQAGTQGSSTIADIKQIKQVYSPIDAQGHVVAVDDDHPYVYKYSDNSYSDGQSHGNGTGLGPMLFDCTWIELPSTASPSHSLVNNSMYYFEVPVNKGEYALGSVPGGSGAYLLYLDIGAGAANYKTVTVTETIDSVYTNILFPKGIDFADLTDASTLATKVAGITGGNSSCIGIATTTKAIEMEYAYTSTTNNDIVSSVLALTNPGNDPPPITALDLAAQGEYNTAQYQSTPLTLEPSYTVNLVRTTNLDFNPSAGTGTETKVVSEVYEIISEISSLKIQLPTSAPAARTWEGVDGPATVSGGLVTFSAAGTAHITSGWTLNTEVGPNWTPMLTNNEDGDVEDPIFVFHFVDYTAENATPPNVVVTTVYSGVVAGETSADQTCTYYYDITVSNTSGKALIIVFDEIHFPTIEGASYVVRLNYGNTQVNVTGAGSYSIPAAA